MGTFKVVAWRDDNPTGIVSKTSNPCDRTEPFGNECGGHTFKLSGGGQAHTHNIPYTGVVVWKRTA